MLGLFIFGANSARAYGVETHGYLTKAIVDFYNKHFLQNKISEESASFLIDGARLEDNVPRYFNHFYDPVNNRGLEDKIYRGIASKLWAQDETEQLALIYRIIPQTEIPTLLTASQIQQIKPDFNHSDFTWQKAIELYAKGEKEKALFTLGHTLHLIEDASVPDHTRNDSHPPFDDGGSPYENWTHKFDLRNFDFELTGRLKNKKPISLNTLDEYFDGIANYSNNNFYSKDSINNYISPAPDYFVNIHGDNYGFKKDKEFGDYALVLNHSQFNWAKERTGELDYQIIMRGYWNRLSVKAVQYGAGVINLFFEEGEKARQKYLTEKSQRPYLATLIDGVSAIFGGSDPKDPSDLVNEFKLVSEIPIAKKDALPLEVAPAKESKPKPKIETEIISLQLQSAEPIAVPSVSPETPVEESVKICTFLTAQSPSRSGVIINEVAWMGTSESASNEWIELQNRSSAEIDLAGSSLIDMDEKIRINLSGKISAGGFWILERTDDNSVPGIAADQVYTGSLENAGEGLRLFDKNCNLLDEVMAAPDWPAGDNSYKKTMERATDFSWRTYSGESAGGTPKVQNSEGIAPVNNSGGGSAPQPAQPQPQQSAPEPEQQQQSTPFFKVLISEVLFDADGSDSDKEFIELYNPNDASVDLSTWSIQHLSSSGSLTKKNFETGDSIGPKGFFLIWLGNDPRADLVWSSGSLNNSSATIYLANNTDQVSTTSAPTNVADSINYDVSNLSGFIAGQSLERKALVDGVCTTPRGSGEYLGNGCDTDSSLDWELRDAPNPQNTQSLPEPRPAPAAINDLQIAYASTSLSTSSSSTSELIFNWSLVFGAEKYHIVDVATTTANSANLAISETGRDYNFTAYSVDKEGFYSSSTAASIFIEAPVGGDVIPPEPEPESTPTGISNIIFSRDAGGNYLSFTLKDVLNDANLVRYILVWFNEDPKEMWDPANRSSGLVHNWAGYCPSTGNVTGNGGTEGGTGFENYVVPGYEPANKPPVYNPNQESYSYKIYFAESCPSTGFHQGRDLKGELTAEDFVTLGWWFYDPVMGFINEGKSVNYPGKIYFVPQ